jgi:hypothetical protein
MIWEYSEGIPRKINILCDNALLIGYGIEKKEIDKEIIQEAIRDLSWSPYLKPTDAQNSFKEDTPALAAASEAVTMEERAALGSAAIPEGDIAELAVANLDGRVDTAAEENPKSRQAKASTSMFKSRFRRLRSKLITSFFSL